MNKKPGSSNNINSGISSEVNIVSPEQLEKYGELNRINENFDKQHFSLVKGPFRIELDEGVHIFDPESGEERIVFEPDCSYPETSNPDLASIFFDKVSHNEGFYVTLPYDYVTLSQILNEGFSDSNPRGDRFIGDLFYRIGAVVRKASESEQDGIKPFSYKQIVVDRHTSEGFKVLPPVELEEDLEWPKRLYESLINELSEGAKTDDRRHRLNQLVVSALRGYEDGSS